MSTSMPTVASVPPTIQQRRPSLMRPGQTAKRSDVDSRVTASPGPDVTSTSPVMDPSLDLIHPMPPPSLYQPSPSSATPSAEPEPPSAFSSASVPPSASAPEPSSALPATTVKVKENTGRWLAEEHEVFLKGLNEHGKQWKKIAVMIKTRSVVQVRTHAQKYFQKLHKNEKKAEGQPGKASSISTSTATSTSTGVKRKSSIIKGNKTTGVATAMTKKRRVSLEPKPKKQQQFHQQAPPLLMASAPPLPVAPTAAVAAASDAVDHSVIDPSFMNSLHMAEGELADSLLDLLDDSSVEAVEHVIGSDDMDLEPNEVEPNPVSPSVSSMSLVEATAVVPDEPQANEIMINRHDIVSSPNPEDFSIHNTIGTSSISGMELSPTGVACVMDIKDFEQKTSGYVDALDWLMDVGVHQLPATEGEEEWNTASATTATVVSLPSRSVEGGAF